MKRQKIASILILLLLVFTMFSGFTPFDSIPDEIVLDVPKALPAKPLQSIGKLPPFLRAKKLKPSAAEAADKTVEVFAEPVGELLSPSGLTAVQLQAGLIGALKPYAENFLAAEEETGVNALFLAALAAHESGWNSSAVAKNRNNLFGWTSNDGYRHFESVEECIAVIAEKLRVNYLSPDGCYFKGYTVEAVNVRYNGNPQWETQVRQIMRDIERRIEKAGLVNPA